MISFFRAQGRALKLGPALFVFAVLNASAAPPGVLEKAESLRLYDDPQWLKLVHYESGLFGTKGDIYSSAFYLAPEGRTNPRAELFATLEGLYSKEVREFEALHGDAKEKTVIRCQFPARALFLMDRLQLKESDLPKVDCSRYEKFRDSFQARSVFLVFSSYYLNNPSSAFGHTFLRFSKSAPRSLVGDKNELLDVGVSNGAEMTTENPVFYAIGGLFGIFRGIYTKMPYYYKVREYNDYEARDLYSYELNLTQTEIDLLVAHVWEVGAHFSRYFYLKQNCAYQILSLIEAAAPRYNLLERLKFYVIPTDTIRVVNEMPGLVHQVTYRPSIRTVFFKRLEPLSDKEVDAFEDWAVKRQKPAQWDQFDKKKQAQILDTAIDYIDFQFAKEVLIEKTAQSLYREVLLKERAGLGVRSEPLKIEEDINRSPHRGHRSSRPGLSWGREKTAGGFIQGDVRFALHDLLDAPRGYPENAQLGMMDFAFRWQTDQKQFEVEHIRFADIHSLSPRQRFVKNTSFKVDMKGMRFRDPGCDRCFGTQIDGGFGYAWDIGPKSLPIVVFGHAEFETALAGFSGSNVRLGAGPGTGLLIGGGRARLLATWSPRWLAFSKVPFYYKERLEARFTTSESISFGAGVESVSQHWQSSVKGYFYF